PPAADVRLAVAQRIETSEQLPSRGRAHRRDMEVGQANAFAVQAVEVRRLEHRIAVTRKVGVTLVIGEHQNDVGLVRRGGLRSERARRRQTSEQGKHYS